MKFQLHIKAKVLKNDEGFFFFTLKCSEMYPGGCSGSVVECLTQLEGLWVQASLEALHCVFEQDTLSSAEYLFNPGRHVPT